MFPNRIGSRLRSKAAASSCTKPHLQLLPESPRGPVSCHAESIRGSFSRAPILNSHVYFRRCRSRLSPLAKDIFILRECKSVTALLVVLRDTGIQLVVKTWSAERARVAVQTREVGAASTGGHHSHLAYAALIESNRACSYGLSTRLNPLHSIHHALLCSFKEISACRWCIQHYAVWTL